MVRSDGHRVDIGCDGGIRPISDRTGRQWNTDRWESEQPVPDDVNDTRTPFVLVERWKMKRTMTNVAA